MSNVTAVPIQPVKRGYLVWLWLGIIAAVAVAVGAAWMGTAKVVAAKGSNAQFLAWNAGQSGVQRTASGLQYQVLEPATGDAKAKPGPTDVALLSYEGRLRDGTQFDASERPVPMPLGGGVIPGFSEAVQLMPKGAKYRFWIPPELGYKDQPRTDQTGKEIIPANSVLVFDVKLVEFIPEALYQQMMQAQMGGAMPPGAGGQPQPQGQQPQPQPQPGQPQQ